MGFDKCVFANRLRGKRNERHLTQGQLAKAADSTVASISSYERETSDVIPTTGTLCNLCKALNCDPNYLLGWEREGA